MTHSLKACLRKKKFKRHERFGRSPNRQIMGTSVSLPKTAMFQKNFFSSFGTRRRNCEVPQVGKSRDEEKTNRCDRSEKKKISSGTNVLVGPQTGKSWGLRPHDGLGKTAMFQKKIFSSGRHERFGTRRRNCEVPQVGKSRDEEKKCWSVKTRQIMGTSAS